MRARRGLILTALVALALAAPALAAHPSKGGVYTGTKNPSSIEPKTLKLRVSHSGKRLNAYLYCGTPRPVNSIHHVKISRRGYFKGKYKTGSLVVLTIKGRFTSRDSARVKFHPYAACDAHGGTVTVKRKGT